MSDLTSATESDFIDRVQQLGDLGDIARNVEKRIVLVVGRRQIGKTSLLKEFRDSTRSQDFTCFYYDLATRPPDLDNEEKPFFLAIADEILLQLEPQGMEVTQLESDIAAARHMRAPRSHMEQLSDARAMLDRHLGKRRAGVQETTGARREGGIDFHGGTAISDSQFAARDQYIFEKSRDESEEVQAAAKGLVTESLKKTLTAFTSQRCVVFLFDHWKRSNDDTRLWLIHSSFFNWVRYRQFPKAVLVIASDQVEDWYEASRDYATIKVAELPLEAVIVYWVDRMHLPRTKLPGDLRPYRFPPLLTLLAQEISYEQSSESGSP